MSDRSQDLSYRLAKYILENDIPFARNSRQKLNGDLFAEIINCSRLTFDEDIPILDCKAKRCNNVFLGERQYFIKGESIHICLCVNVIKTKDGSHKLGFWSHGQLAKEAPKLTPQPKPVVLLAREVTPVVVKEPVSKAISYSSVAKRGTIVEEKKKEGQDFNARALCNLIQKSDLPAFESQLELYNKTKAELEKLEQGLKEFKIKANLLADETSNLDDATRSAFIRCFDFKL